jgi:hypothetical protein
MLGTFGPRFFPRYSCSIPARLAPLGGDLLEADMDKQPTRSRRVPYWLLIIPFIALLIPYFYNFMQPSIGGVPFFYWYQIAWVFITAALTWFIFAREEA